MATRCSPPRTHPTSCRSGSACTLSTDTAAAVVAHPLSIAFHLSRFFATLIHLSLFFILFSFVCSVSSSLRKSFISSSHLSFGLPIGLFVWCLVLRPRFHLAPCFAHRSSGDHAILIANRHSFVCAFQFSMGFWLFSLSIASAVLLFMYSILSSSSISPVSISSSVSFMKEMSLSWS